MRIRARRDRISSLPDDIIGRILSFLPIKSAVQTSTLSKRWQYLWTFITNLNFEENLLDARNPADIVRRVLRRCISKQINRFSLTVNGYVCAVCIDACSNDLIRRNIRELRLEGPIIANRIFTCKTLTSLDLKSNVILLDTEDIPTFDLPNLKKLRTHLVYPSSDLSEKLFSSCPVLEDLTIEGTVRTETIFNLSCPLLRRLKIQLEAWDFEGLKYKFVINTPHLKYLELIDMFKAEYVVENLTSVVEAKMKMRQGAAAEVFGNLAAELLWAFGDLQSLSIDEDCLARVTNHGIINMMWKYLE
ncbi:F-box/LRR-repeat protein [Forsythia ovata]|uniref:F-box/LRR-repeat protein n=1 Tax=Forsythia ovata TaxID=205694 RepID=A0ABD1U9L0_9LAMI